MSEICCKTRGKALINALRFWAVPKLPMYTICFFLGVPLTFLNTSKSTLNGKYFIGAFLAWFVSELSVSYIIRLLVMIRSEFFQQYSSNFLAHLTMKLSSFK